MSEEPKIQPAYGSTNPPPASEDVRRVASVIGLNAEQEQRYRDLHADVWQSVIDRLRLSNIQNYSIFVTETGGQKYLFSYFEYTGPDFDADMQKIAADPETRRWWLETDPCVWPMPGCAQGEMWQQMEKVFFLP